MFSYVTISSTVNLITEWWLLNKIHLFEVSNEEKGRI